MIRKHYLLSIVAIYHRPFYICNNRQLSTVSLGICYFRVCHFGQQKEMKSSYHWQLVENTCLIYKMRVFLYYYFYSHTGKKHITKHRKIL